MEKMRGAAEIINEGLYCKELIEGLGRHVGIMKGRMREQRRRRKEPAGGRKVVKRCNGGKGEKDSWGT